MPDSRDKYTWFFLNNTVSTISPLLVGPSRYALAREVTEHSQEQIYARELCTFSQDTRWHFSTLPTSAARIEDFKPELDRMAADMEVTAPHLWRLLGALHLGGAVW